MLIYKKEVIDITCKWFEDSNNAKLWLQNNNHEELVQLKNALIRYDKGLEFLLLHKHVVLAAFVNAALGDKKAFKILMDKKEFVWAAVANLILGDDKAAMFLQKSNMIHYIHLATVILAKIRKVEDEGTSIFGGPFRVEK